MPRPHSGSSPLVIWGIVAASVLVAGVGWWAAFALLSGPRTTAAIPPAQKSPPRTMREAAAAVAAEANAKLGPGQVHVGDAYAAIDALAANATNSDWWEGTVVGSVVRVDVSNNDNVHIIISDMRSNTTNTVTVIYRTDDAVKKMKKGDTVTFRGRGRERDFYRYGSVFMERSSLLPNHSGN